VRSNPSLAQRYNIISSTYQHFLVASTEESGKGRGDSNSCKGKELKLHLWFVCFASFANLCVERNDRLSKLLGAGQEQESIGRAKSSFCIPFTRTPGKNWISLYNLNTIYIYCRGSRFSVLSYFRPLNNESCLRFVTTRYFNK